MCISAKTIENAINEDGGKCTGVIMREEHLKAEGMSPPISGRRYCRYAQQVIRHQAVHLAPTQQLRDGQAKDHWAWMVQELVQAKSPHLQFNGRNNVPDWSLLAREIAKVAAKHGLANAVRFRSW